MPDNGSGIYTPPAADFPAVGGTLILATKFNNVINDIATAISNRVARDGQSPPTANLPMGGFKFVNVADGTARASPVANFASLGQVQDGGVWWAGTAGGTADALTLTMTPAIPAYVAGQRFIAKSGASPNTGAATLAVSGLAAKAIQRNGAALAAGEIPANLWFEFLYDGAAFQVSPFGTASSQIFSGLVTVIDGNFSILGSADATKKLRFEIDTAPTGTTEVLTVAAANVVEGVQGANIASAATVNLDTATGDYIHVTGVVTITAITLAQGRERTLVFDGALVLTNNAVILNPTGASITTAAGDTAVVRGEAAGVVRVVAYNFNTVTPASSGAALVLLSAQVASASAQIDFTSGLTATYDEYELHINGLTPATDAQDVWLRISQDSGVSFKAGATDYSWNIGRFTDAATTSATGSTGDTKMTMQASLTNTSGRQNLVVRITRPSSSAANKAVFWNGTSQGSAGGSISSMGSGYYKTDNTAWNALRVTMSSGNITSGNFLLYGIKKS